MQRCAVWAGVLAICGVMGAQEPVSIQVDLSKPVGAYKPVYSWFGYDEANYTTAPDGQKLLRELHDLSPVPVSIRAHHLLTSGDGVAELKFSSTNVYTEDANGKPVYDFKILDGIFDAYKAACVRPMVELGFMPEALAADVPGRTEPYQVHYPKSTISGRSNNPPRDYKKWGELIRVVTAHLVERYGKEEVLRWYFEVWNEPDIDYWHAPAEDYWKLYDYAVAGVRTALPGAKVGGPASTSPRSEKARLFLKNFLDHVDTGSSAADGKRVPMDFITFHAKGSPKIAAGKVTMGIASELRDADEGFKLIAGFPRFKSLPIILSEADPEGCAACSSKVEPANNYRNGTLYPAYTADALKGLFELQDRHGVNLLGMLSWSFEFEDKEYFEGFRDLATNGVDKPVLNVFRMFGLMSGSRVAVTSSGRVDLDAKLAAGVREKADVDALATKGDRSAAVLVWNYDDIDGKAAAAKTTVSIGGMPAGVTRVLLEHYRLDDTHSNSYTVWKGMGSPQKPTEEQYKELQASGRLEMLTSPEWVEVKGGVMEVKMSLPRDGVSLLRVSW
ncbi:GH39 family glycosyl hydrolase [Granulicella tundricola]|uniref:Glycoside hydrolase family 39 n=1 Tax=Granulicella tundricola (strain ATCC BAA-1859 / DSM 23138 / MP5ACTX9) TaxID=1198114 RepID=E8X2S4_GRATM|nr:beta-xylosidase [Granulicella tundricola]ADW70371.1 glycoside hydrolase family 39 [Granulicella tundricola MP5ACTX9]